MQAPRSPSVFRFLLCISLLVGAPSLALGQEDLTPKQVAEYERSLADAAKKFESEDYRGARSDLERAYELFPNPRILFSIGGTYRREGKNDEALAIYRKFLDECSTEVCRVENKEPIAIAEKTIAELEAEAKAEAEPEVIEDETEPEERDQPASPGKGWRWAGTAFVVVGVGALGFAGVDQLRASGLADDIENELDRNGNTWTPALAAKEQDGEDLEKRARIVAIGGGVVTAVGLGMLIYGLTREADEGEVTLVPSAGSDTLGLALVGRF